MKQISSFYMAGFLSLIFFCQYAQADYIVTALTGSWQSSNCIEKYDFGIDHALTIKGSQDKDLKGIYQLVYFDNADLPILNVKMSAVNESGECLSNKFENNGKSLITHVKLDNKLNPTQMVWCRNKEGKDCPVSLTRINWEYLGLSSYD
ncbi:MAG: hypothetical protein Q4G13_04610 [Moraxella sp.]|nr:hypothetical protein [Moraxella sp.]